jgi:uncharacterized membrane protein YedE/YeeE
MLLVVALVLSVGIGVSLGLLGGGMLSPRRKDFAWRALFVAGLIAGGATISSLSPASYGVAAASTPIVVTAGLLVGFGTRLGNGCTSGHGVCGVARFSRRSLAATAVFVATGMITVFVVQRLGGVS